MAEVKIEDAPQGVQTYYDKGIAALERDNFDYAMDMFEAILNLEPCLLQIRRMLRATAIKKRQTSPLRKLTKAKTVSGFIKATSSLKRNPRLTIELSEKLLRIDPLNIKFSKLQCEAATAAALPEIAIQTLEIIAENSAPNLEVLEPLSRLYRASGQFDMEYNCLETMAGLKPNDRKILKELKDSAARLTMGKADWQQAERLRNEVRQHAESGKQVDELTHLKKRVDAEPDNFDIQRTLAETQFKNRQFSDAIHTLKICIKLNGGDPRTEKLLWQSKEQLILFRTAAAEDAHNTEAVSKLRKELIEMRTEAAAKKVKQYPNDLQLKFEYAKWLFESNDLSESIRQFQLAQHNPHRRIRSLIYLGKAFEKKEQLNMARQQFETALNELENMNETRKEVLYELGLIHEKAGNSERMMACFKEIYGVDIGYRDVAVHVEN